MGGSVAGTEQTLSISSHGSSSHDTGDLSVEELDTTQDRYT